MATPVPRMISPASTATQSCRPVNGSVWFETAAVAPRTPPLRPFEPAEAVSPSTAPVFDELAVVADPDVFAEPELFAEPAVLADPDVFVEPEAVVPVEPAPACFFSWPGAEAFADRPVLVLTPAVSVPDVETCVFM